MARIAVQFVANSNMGAVSKDIAKINAQLATMAAEMKALEFTNPAGFNSMLKTFRSDIAKINGYETATMSARTATAEFTDSLNRNKATMKDLSKLRANDSRIIKQLAQEQLRLADSSAMITKRDLATGRVMGELIVPTKEYTDKARVATMETGIMGKAMYSAGLQTEAAGKRMQWTGRQLSAGLTTPIVALGAVAAKAAYDIDDAMVRVEKVYGGLAGVTEQEMNRVKQATLDTAETVVNRFGISAKETVNLAGELAAAGYEGQDLQSTILEIQRISMLGQLDQQKAMDATRTIQTVFGISTMDLANKFNFLNAVENETNTTLQDLTEVIPRTGGVIKDLGGTLEDSAIFTVAFKEAGIDAVQGANALRSSLGAIVAPSGVASKKLQALGIDMAQIVENNRQENGGSLMSLLKELGEAMDGLGSVERQQALSVLFGRYQFNKLGGLLKGLTENANDTSTQVGRAMALTGASMEELAAVAAREEAKIRESLSGRLRIAAQQLVLTFSEMGRPILALVVAVAEFVSGVFKVLNQLPGIIKGSVLALGLVLALSGPLMFFAGIFRVLYGNVFKWVGSMLMGKAKLKDLFTTQTMFQQHALTSVIPAIQEQTGATQALGAAIATTAAQMRDLVVAQRASASAGISAGSVAGKTNINNQHRLAAGSPVDPNTGRGTGGRVAPLIPAGTVMLPIVSRESVDNAAELGKQAKEGEKSSRLMRGHWSGIASSALLITPLIMSMTGATGGWSTAIMGVLLTLGLFPSILSRIGKGIAGMKIASAFTGSVVKGKAALAGFGAGAKGATTATRLLTASLTALKGPLGIIIAGIAAVMWGWNKYNEKIKEAKAETNAMNTAAESLAGVIGYEYKTAQAGVAMATTEGTKTLHDQAKAWLETGEKAQLAAKQIEEAANIETAAMMARRIGLDALAHGAEMEEAFRAAQAAMLAAGYNYRDVQGQIKITDFVDKDAALKLEVKDTGKAFGQALTSGFTEGAKADQALKDFGPKIAAQLNGKSRNEIFDALTTLIDDVNLKAYDMFEEINFEQADFDIMQEQDIDLGSLEDVRKFFEEDLPRLQADGKLQELPAGMEALGNAAALAADKEEILVNQLKEARGWTSAHYKDIRTLSQFREIDSGLTMNQADAEAHYTSVLASERTEYNKMRAAASRAGVELGPWNEAQELALLNTHRLARGLPATTDLTLGFGTAAVAAADDVSELNAAMEAVDPASFLSGMRTAVQGNINEAIGMLMDQFDDETDAHKEHVSRQNQIWQDGLEARKQASEDEFEARQRREEEAFEQQEKAMDTRHEKTMDEAEKAKDARVKAIEDEMDKADELDEKRKRMFEAEITRMQRLQAAANRNIDFNIALKTGNLDEAARIQESAYVEETTNQMNDAGSTMDDNSAQRRAAGETRIAAVTNAEDARIARIQDVIDKEKEQFEKSKQRSKDALEAAKRDAANRFEAEKRSYEESARAAEKSYDRAREAKRKQTLESLEMVALEVPKNIQEYQRMFGTLDAEYTKQTGKAAAKTTEWNNLHRTGFHTAMETTFRELANEAAWKTVGATSVDSMVQGMLGMTFAEFANWMQTGVLPKKRATLPPNTGGGTNPMKLSGEGSMGGLHSGGPVDGSQGSRAGRPWDAPLYADEVPTILQKGEFVVQKKAVDKIGPGTLAALNSGQTSFFHEGGMVGAAGAKIMSTFKQAAGLAIQQGAARKAQEIAAQGRMEDIPEALKFVTQAAAAGKFGNTNLNDEQLRNAATIIGVGRSMGATERDLIVAVMTALQESTLRNVNYGDRDSVGLFQQRTSQGWGTIEQIMDPRYSSRKFFEALLRIKGRGDMGLAQTAQAVQRSAFPEAYAKWEDEARAIIAASMNGAGNGLNAGQYGGGGIFKLGGGTVTGDIKGLNIEFLNRLARWAAAVGQPYNVGSGFRSMAEQAILYNRYISGVPGQAPAAPPGKSNHNYGLASDGPHWGNKNPGAFGLRYPMSYEPWHVEPIGAREMRIPQLETGGTVKFDDTIANLHKRETVLTAPLSQKLEQGINALDSGGSVQYNININGANQNADQIADKVMQKIQRMEQVKGPKRVIR